MDESQGADETAFAERLIVISGTFLLLAFGAGNALSALDIPAPGDPAEEIVSMYQDRWWRIATGATLSLLSLAALGLLAAAVVTVWTQRTGQAVLARASFAGAVVVMAAGAAAETINLAAALYVHGAAAVAEDTVVALFEISQMFGTLASGFGVGVMAAALGWAALRGTPPALSCRAGWRGR